MPNVPSYPDITGAQLQSATNAQFLLDKDGTTSNIEKSELKKFTGLVQENNSPTGTTYTLLASDQDQIVVMTNAGTKTVTIPNATGFDVKLPIVVSNEGAGLLTFVAAGGVTVKAPGLTLNQYQAAVLYPRSATEWRLLGPSNAASNAVTLNAPGSFNATAVSTTEIDLTWTDTNSSPNEQNFTIERSLDNVSWTSQATPAANSTSYNATGLTAGTLYYFRIKANGNGSSTLDSTYATDSATTSAGGMSIATAPWESRFDCDASVSGGPSVVDDGTGKAERVKDVIHPGFSTWDFITSGPSNNPTIVSSGINSKKCILVDTGKFMNQTLSNHTGAVTLFCVLQPKTSLAAFGYFLAGTNGHLDFGHGSGTGFGGGAKPYLYTGNGSVNYGSNNLVVDTSYVICLRKDASSANFKMWVNTTVEVDGAISGANTDYGGMLLGHSSDGSPCWIREGGYIKQALSDADVLSLINEFKSRNAIA